MVTRVELGRSHPSGETPAQCWPRPRHPAQCWPRPRHPAQGATRSTGRVRRLPAVVLGAITALTIVAAGWPGMASASVHSPGPPGTAPTAQPWLLGPAAPGLLPSSATAPAIRTDGYVAPLKHVLPVDV